MGKRRRDRWVPGEPFSVPREARGEAVKELEPPRPVRSRVQLPDRLIRVEATALAMTPDAVLVEWGDRSARQSAWVWRRAVRHRSVTP